MAGKPLPAITKRLPGAPLLGLDKVRAGPTGVGVGIVPVGGGVGVDIVPVGVGVDIVPVGVGPLGVPVGVGPLGVAGVAVGTVVTTPPSTWLLVPVALHKPNLLRAWTLT